MRARNSIYFYRLHMFVQVYVRSCVLCVFVCAVFKAFSFEFSVIIEVFDIVLCYAQQANYCVVTHLNRIHTLLKFVYIDMFLKV